MVYLVEIKKKKEKEKERSFGLMNGQERLFIYLLYFLCSFLKDKMYITLC